jgi:hypothetical protein
LKQFLTHARRRIVAGAARGVAGHACRGTLPPTGVLDREALEGLLAMALKRGERRPESAHKVADAPPRV